MKRRRETPLLYMISACLISVTLSNGCSYLPVQRAATYARDLYRRIPYKVEGNRRVIDIFYATSREVSVKEDAALSFKPKLGAHSSYGIVNVKVDPQIKIGKMLPNRLKRRGIIGIQEVQKLETDAFMKELKEAVDKSPHKSLLVVVFGYKDDFQATAIKAAYFAYLLDVNTPVLLFDWPGDQPVSPWGYEKARSLAVESGPYLGETLTKIIREVKPEKLWVKASSLGCQVVCDAFDHMYKYDDLADSDTEIDHVILAAPDVGEKEFNLHFKDQFAALSRKVTAYVSSNDEALLLSAIIDGEKKLGREGMKKHAELDETKDILYLKSLHPDKVALIDVTPINISSYRHGYYLESPEFYDDFYMRIFDKEPYANRRLYLLRTKDNVDYWVLRR